MLCHDLSEGGLTTALPRPIMSVGAHHSLPRLSESAHYSPTTTNIDFPILDEHGRNAYGEHVWRVTGSRHLLSMVLPVATIMRVARWGSSIVLRYLGDAPLTLTATYIGNRQNIADRTATAAAHTWHEEPDLGYDNSELLR